MAPRGTYTDKVTGEKVAGVTTGQIYWGSVPFVVIQVVMIAITIAFPGMVMHYKGKVIDPSTIEITIPSLQPLGGGTIGGTAGGTLNGLPTLGAPKLGAPVVNP